jgi:hypothetical protein
MTGLTFTFSFPNLNPYKYMQTNKHTSGPWHYAPGELIYGPDGESVASCRFVTNYKETNVANMRLVAAAPDLLAAAIAALTIVNREQPDGSIAADLLKAIRKAEKGGA